MRDADFRTEDDGERRGAGWRTGDPVPVATYAGFAASAPGPEPGTAEPRQGQGRTYARSELRRRPSRRGWGPAAAGTALAVTVAVGAVFGLALLYGPERQAPELQGPELQRPELQRPAPLPAQPAPIRDAPPPAPAPARADAITLAPLPPAAIAPARTEASARAVTEARPRKQAPRPAALRAPGARVDARFAALDQRVNEAFAVAIRSGAAAGPLGQEQANWIILRDRIRREHPEMATDLYRERIAELEAISAKKAEGTPAGPG